MGWDLFYTRERYLREKGGWSEVPMIESRGIGIALDMHGYPNLLIK